jgi:hypothetical protein
LQTLKAFALPLPTRAQNKLSGMIEELLLAIVSYELGIKEGTRDLLAAFAPLFFGRKKSAGRIRNRSFCRSPALKRQKNLATRSDNARLRETGLDRVIGRANPQSACFAGLDSANAFLAS